MATVTGLTAARMLLIEAASVISGVITGDNLILTKKDGSTINAGNVRGPKGDTGIGFNATEMPGGINLDNQRTSGIYTQTLNTEAASGTNYPAPLAGVLEVYMDPTFSFGWQRYTTYETAGVASAVYTRNYFNSAWSVWRRFQLVGEFPKLWNASSSSVQSLVSGTTTAINAWTYASGTSTAAVTEFGTMDASGNFTFSKAGFYNFDFAFTFSSNTAGRKVSEIYINGSEIRRANSGAASDATIQVTANYQIAVNDIASFRVYQNSGSALTGSAPFHTLAITRFA